MRQTPQHGFTYLGVLLGVALIGVGLLAASQVWTTQAAREKSIQLQWAAQQYQRAIDSYYHASPSGVKTYPPNWGELIEDHRFAIPRRHLRFLYPNPFSARMDWEPIRAADGGIQGVAIHQERARNNFWVYPSP